MRERQAGWRAAGWRVTAVTAVTITAVLSTATAASTGLPVDRVATGMIRLRIAHPHHEAAWLFGAAVILALVLLVEIALGAVLISRRLRRRTSPDAVGSNDHPSSPALLGSATPGEPGAAEAHDA
jgi:hypothetical protein